MSNPPPADGPDANNHPPHGHTPARFSELLNYLFATKLKTVEGGQQKRYTLREVADATGISIGFLSEARHGNKENPPKEFIELLAEFFGVPPAFFFGPLPGETASLEAALQQALVKSSMSQILLRASAYTDIEREMLLDLMDSIERALGKVTKSPRTGDQENSTGHDA
jgi:transcriptional regulator with XRE-family HTH domain